MRKTLTVIFAVAAALLAPGLVLAGIVVFLLAWAAGRGWRMAAR